MERAGLTPLVAVIDYPGDKWEVDNERRTAEWLEGLNGNYPTACFVISDTNAVGVLRGLRKMNLQVPEDVSVIGCSDLDFARMLTAPLTTINQDSYGMGHTGVQIGIDRREGRLTGEPVVKVQPHRLVERMTTQRPNADENGPPAKSARRKGKSRARSDTVPA